MRPGSAKHLNSGVGQRFAAPSFAATLQITAAGHAPFDNAWGLTPALCEHYRAKLEHGLRVALGVEFPTSHLGRK